MGHGADGDGEAAADADAEPDMATLMHTASGGDYDSVSGAKVTVTAALWA